MTVRNWLDIVEFQSAVDEFFIEGYQDEKASQRLVMLVSQPARNC